MSCIYETLTCFVCAHCDPFIFSWTSGVARITLFIPLFRCNACLVFCVLFPRHFARVRFVSQFCYHKSSYFLLYAYLVSPVSCSIECGSESCHNAQLSRVFS